MAQVLEGCAVCGGPAGRGGRLSRVIIQGRSLDLCRVHAAVVAAARPETFDEMLALFASADADLAAQSLERRAGPDRRAQVDRRAFPPRPEGRRLNGGRRAEDPREA